MRTHGAYVDDPVREIDCHYEPVGIALDVEDHPVVANDARVAVHLLQAGRRIPQACTPTAAGGKVERDNTEPYSTTASP